MRHSEIAQRLTDMTGCSLDDSKAEVDATIERLFHYGAYADKYGGTVQVREDKQCCAHWLLLW